jgi:hypothetical protein
MTTTAGVLLSLVLFFAFYAPRPDLLDAMRSPTTAAKTLLPLALALTLFAQVKTSGIPGATLKKTYFPIVILIVVIGLFVHALLSPPPQGISMALLGKSLLVCLTSILGFSLVIGAGMMVYLRQQAPTRLGLSGLLVGLASGGMAAALYSFYCTEDSPLFYALWYTLGILLAGGTGLVAGKRVLKW